MNAPKPLILYDGKCGLCTSSSLWIRRLDWLKRFDHLPYQYADLVHQFPQLKERKLNERLHLVFPDGKVLDGVSALRSIGMRTPLFFLSSLLLYFPPFLWLAEILYRFVARYRRKIWGTCELPPKKK